MVSLFPEQELAGFFFVPRLSPSLVWLHIDTPPFILYTTVNSLRLHADWSTEQLEKHHKELSGQLGNYFLRIASPRIAGLAVPLSQNVHEALPTDLKQLFLESPDAPSLPAANADPNYEQLRLTRALPARVAAHMEACEVGAALAEIVEVLKHVRIPTCISTCC